MALTTTNANMVLADRTNAKRQSLGIPAGPNADEPGLLVLESCSDAKAYSQVFLWADSTGVLRYHTSLPTNEDSDGSVLATTADSSLLRDLSNMIASSIPSSLISDTTLTDDLGSSSIYWNNAYINKVYGNSTASIDGTTAGKFVVTGAVDFGVAGTGADITFFGDTSGYDMLWDYSADGLLFKDNAKLLIGTSSDITVTWDATDLIIDGAAANTAIKVGYTNNQDLYIYGATATNYIHFNTDDTAKVASFVNFGVNFANGTITYATSWSTNSLVLSATDNSASKIILGSTGTNGLDIDIQSATAGDLISFNAGAKTMTFTDVAGIFLKNSASFEGLAIPYSTSTATGATTTGSIHFETDTGYLSVYNGAAWVKTTLS